jgi:hypothetical protein
MFTAPAQPHPIARFEFTDCPDTLTAIARERAAWVAQLEATAPAYKPSHRERRALAAAALEVENARLEAMARELVEEEHAAARLRFEWENGFAA